MTEDVETPIAVGDDVRVDTPQVGDGRFDEDGGSNGAGDHPAETAPEGKKGRNRAVLEWGILIVVAIVVAIGIKTFLFQAFYIPSASMVPTLEVGDRVLVNKLSYDLHDLHRGDIVVFTASPNTQWHRAGISDLVKRVIALPGETVSQCETDRVCIDDKLLDEGYLPKGTITTFPSDLPYINGANGRKVLVCDATSKPGSCKVPAGKVFVMGDNRGNSQDARANGPIKESSIVGRVFVRIWPLNRLGLL
ncbi:MAG: signal peptidase I [Acidimicrobiia bacterium]